MSFSALPLEVRKMIYSLLEPTFEEDSFNNKDMQQDADDNEE